MASQASPEPPILGLESVSRAVLGSVYETHINRYRSQDLSALGGPSVIRYILDHLATQGCPSQSLLTLTESLWMALVGARSD